MALPNYSNNEFYSGDNYLKVSKKKKSIENGVVSIEVKNRNFKAKLIIVSITLIIICGCGIIMKLTQ